METQYFVAVQVVTGNIDGECIRICFCMNFILTLVPRAMLDFHQLLRGQPKVCAGPQTDRVALP